MSTTLNNNQGIAANNSPTGETVQLRSYQHASRLFGVDEDLARMPKLGFLYYVKFNVNRQAVYGNNHVDKNKLEVGLLCKKIDLPKFELTTETINQYNRKTLVQTQIKYNPINIDFHDDNSEITTSLWTDYYQYYYTDSNQTNAAFGDTKFGNQDYLYGLDAYQTAPFFNSIDVYVLHQKNYTKITLVNPKITSWKHDQLDADQDTKIMTNSMTVMYESVKYAKGQIKAGESDSEFTTLFYDNTPSPISNAGNNANSQKDASGKIPGEQALTGKPPPGATVFTKNAPAGRLPGIDPMQLAKYNLQQQNLGGVLNRNAGANQINQPASIGQLVLAGLGIANLLGVKLPQSKNINQNTIARAVSILKL